MVQNSNIPCHPTSFRPLKLLDHHIHKIRSLPRASIRYSSPRLGGIAHICYKRWSGEPRYRTYLRHPTNEGPWHPLLPEESHSPYQHILLVLRQPRVGITVLRLHMIDITGFHCTARDQPNIYTLIDIVTQYLEVSILHIGSSSLLSCFSKQLHYQSPLYSPS